MNAPTGPVPSAWWRPDIHADRRPFLMARAHILAALRHWFTARDFIEVEPGALQISPGNETHLHAMAVDLRAPAGDSRRLYLHTSPEFACKKLLAAGEEKIVAFARVFRDREGGPLHAAEFTMLEWYRARAPYTALMEDCAALLACAAEAAGRSEARFRGRTCDLTAPPERISVHEAFMRHAGINLAACATRETLAQALHGGGMRVADDDTWSDLFSRALSEKVEPHLGVGRPTILLDYPASEAALARRKPGAPALAERFELYVCGVELANAFGELTDPAEQRARFAADMDEKARIYGERYPIDEDFLAALALMPEASGAALGLDRLVMLAAGADRLDQVIWTPLTAASPSDHEAAR